LQGGGIEGKKFMSDRWWQLREHFFSLADQPEAQVNLGNGALLIAGVEYPQLDTAFYQNRLDQLAERLQHSHHAQFTAENIAGRMNRILVEEEGFHGNLRNYYDPDNSCLNRVLDRRTGIPISLSLVYIEMGRRAGLSMHGVALPGHFIAALFHETGTVYIDAFNRGAILTKEECRQRAQLANSEVGGIQFESLLPESNKAIIKRMLRNLKAIYHNLGHLLKELEMVQWILRLTPHASEELRESGLLYEALGHSSQAIKDFEHYLDVAPVAPDRAIIENKIIALRNTPHWLH
jgi:regulator of sirC expression with transglutaminase-like and TPR domain